MNEKAKDKNITTRGFRVPEKYRDYPSDDLSRALENILFYENDLEVNIIKNDEKLIYKRFQMTLYEEGLISKLKKVFKIQSDREAVILALSLL